MTCCCCPEEENCAAGLYRPVLNLPGDLTRGGLVLEHNSFREFCGSRCRTSGDGGGGGGGCDVWTQHSLGNKQAAQVSM